MTCDDAALTGVNPADAGIRTLAAVTSHPPSPALRALALDSSPSAVTAAQLLELARRLRASAIAGQPAPTALHGKNLAVLQPVDGIAVSALHDAALDLGMRVAQVSLGDPPPAILALGRIARMLGRMYDAIDVGPLAPAAAAELAAHAGVPVYRGLADGSHPLLALVLDGNPVDQASERRYLLQALLLATLG